MAAILTLLIVVALSMFITKIATIALVHTGMARDRARFQARSAFSGAGFTTNESEVVVKHPVRRRVITTLIIIGNAGLVTVISSLILGFSGDKSAAQDTRNLAILFGGALALFLVTKSTVVDRLLNKLIYFVLDKTGSLDRRAYTKIVDLDYSYEITEIDVENNPWLCERTLAELKLPEEGVLVLGIARGNDTYLGAPRGSYRIRKGDRLVLYGREKNLKEIAQVQDKLQAKAEHKERTEEQQEELQKQDTEAGQKEEQ